ncbi:class I SAM-dependent methyltransferase [Chitinophaga sancti]|uniref:Class I SAM-dependent methyltransferase n=1 Tax=Chitinophaga sancti TaxID=1004 RepID=A0A1K1S143_9BACT|nr:class I SAM-dependent methyltransferase [Chitinophaga sancti]WQD59730.1 class I SAM-dependent methyltransferase [Chitinophaga sancti]WQG88139.1 class I SAM-dependent methyltransferase [Chitinophaga sancti]SFW78075.1 Methyltransferase domain-containing protein [Chitinophaga sancti]
MTNEQYKTRWDERYRETDFAYGKTPNLFFKTHLDQLDKGCILMPADGEGRNGVYAAVTGWQVTSTDLSPEGKIKALQLAAEFHTTLTYVTGDLETLQFEPASFDAIGLIYAHFLPEKKSILHRQLDTYLKPGGTIIFEAFSKNHKANAQVGGPTEIAWLFSEDEIREDFSNYDILLLKEEVVGLEEGKYHMGQGTVLRFIGKKKPAL